MNPKPISSSRTKSLPNFPVLKVGKHRRVTTKHFTNLPLWLPSDELEVISFVIYRLKADNTFKYSTELLNQLLAARLQARMEYDRKGWYSPLVLAGARKALKSLIERGLILHTDRKGHLMVNPMLTYECDIISKKSYNEIMEVYQGGDVNKVVELFSSLVSTFLESKKKNYIYGKRR